MFWLNPLAWVGLAAIAAPILIHIFVQRRAERIPFPTLRFIQPTRLAAMRRHVLRDLPLLIVRAMALMVAAGALAGPLLLTPARRQAWNARIARAIVVDRAAAVRSDLSTLILSLSKDERAAEQTFETSDLRDGIARALAWLDTAAPARRELVVVSTFALGSVTRADISNIPADIGVRLVRSGDLPLRGSLAATPVLHSQPHAGAPIERRDRTIELTGPATSVRESAGRPGSVAIEIVAPPDVKQTAEAVLSAVLSQRVLSPPPDRAARVVFTNSSDVAGAAKPGATMPPWVADAIARIMRDHELQASGGRPLMGTSSDGARLVVTMPAPAGPVRTALLFRSILNALAPEPSAERDVLTTPDADLRAWERPAGRVESRQPDPFGSGQGNDVPDDRRWWWAAVLVLLATETWMRRVRANHEQAGEKPAGAGGGGGAPPQSKYVA